MKENRKKVIMESMNGKPEKSDEGTMLDENNLIDDTI